MKSNFTELLAEEHSRKQAEYIASIVGSSKSRFSDLLKILLSDNTFLSQRGSWAVSCCAEVHPEMVQPFLGDLLQNLSRQGLHDAVKRNTMKVVAESALPDEISGLAVDTSFRLLNSPEESLAARVHAMTVLERMCQREPSLVNELRVTIEHHLPYEERSGFKTKARRVLKKLDRQS
ncbi:MAG: hypothetical protein AAF357_13655 [Verrucomicrobiota bacterium]